jgi:hypothetical protein
MQGALESKRDPGTWNGTRCEGPPPVDDPLTHHQWMIHSPTVPPRTHPPRVLWNPREIQAPGIGLDERAHHQWMNMDGLVSIFPLNPTVLVLYSSFESLHPPRVLWNPREIQAPGMGPKECMTGLRTERLQASGA